jgi:hypothetical protein
VDRSLETSADTPTTTLCGTLVRFAPQHREKRPPEFVTGPDSSNGDCVFSSGGGKRRPLGIIIPHWAYLGTRLWLGIGPPRPAGDYRYVRFAGRRRPLACRHTEMGRRSR